MKDFRLKKLPEGKSLLLPTAIDTHVHGRWNEYVQENVGPLQTVLEAQAGGIGTRCFMPNTNPGLTNVDNIKKYSETLEDANLGGRNYMYVGLRDDNLGQAEEALKMPNVVGIKVYPAAASGKSVTTSFGGDDKCAVIDNAVGDKTTLDRAIRLAMKYDKAISFHCESPEKGHDAAAEMEYVENVIIPYAKKYPQAKIIVAHVSLMNTAIDIENINNRFNTNIHMELTPHHLFFSRDDVKEDSKLKCFPPLRFTGDMIYLRKLLSQIGKENRPGLKLMFGSDHAPHAKKNKDKPFDAASGGIPNLRDSLAIIMSLGENEGMTYDQLVQFTSGNASKLLNIPMDYGKVTFQKGKHTPDYDYYDGQVYNPFKDKRLNFQKI